MDSNINDIINSLTPQDIEMLKGVASSILGDGVAENQPVQSNQTPSNQPTAAQNSPMPLQGLGLDGNDFEMIMKAKAIFEKMNSTQNKNVDLIMALKPHLSPQTRDKADRAMRILKLFEVLPLLRELF